MCVAKKFLQQVKLCDKHINNKLEELANLRDLSLRITSNISGNGGHSGPGDKVGNAVARIVDLEREINESIDKYVDLKHQVEAVIEQITDPDEVEVIYKRYFRFKKWEEIAAEMNYTYQGVCKIHGRALQSVREILKTVYKS